MRTVAFVAPKGGTGRTALVANLAALLARATGGRVLAIDFDPRNQLGLHFGMAPTEPAGLASAALAGDRIATALRRAPDGTPYLPFGGPRDSDRATVEQRVTEQPLLLRGWLADAAFADLDLALIDVAAGPSGWYDHALRCADAVLVVLQPDAAGFATLPSLQAQLARHRGAHAGEAWLLLNGVDESRRLSRDVRAVLQRAFGDRVAPAVHHDEAVREALALQVPVVDHRPTSQAADDLRRLADWLAARALLGAEAA